MGHVMTTHTQTPSQPRNQEQQWNAEVIAEFWANGGEVAAPYPDPPPMLLLHTIGARSGREHIVAMRCLQDEDSDTLFVIASAHGSDCHPDWYYNVRANPDFEIEMGTRMIEVHASELHGAERDAIFNRQAARFAVFADYQARLSRTIPVFKLELGQSRQNPLMADRIPRESAS
jgi:deazaflavin-dependent oxidoreductase (nitroreductase family)